MALIIIRCQAKTEDGFREIKVDIKGLTATCSCNGHVAGAFCAHVDAILVFGERYMVPLDDRIKADKAMQAMLGHIKAPAEWKGSWRSKMVWRGLRQPGDRVYFDHSAVHGDGYYDRPKICFTGNGPMKRAELLEHARTAGWQAVDNIVEGLKVLVAEDPTLDNNKLRGARKKAIPIISYDEYMTLTAEGELVEIAI
jgi:hypothetical protein